jgi:hypothetical protein
VCMVGASRFRMKPRRAPPLGGVSRGIVVTPGLPKQEPIAADGLSDNSSCSCTGDRLSSPRMRPMPWLVSSLVVSGASPAVAQTTEHYALAWVRGDGAEECPSAIELQQEVELRVGRHVFEPSAVRSIEVSVRLDGDATPPVRRSDIHIRDASGKISGRRSLNSREPDCHALFSSTALAIALAVDPDASTKQATATPMPVAVPAVSEVSNTPIAASLTPESTRQARRAAANMGEPADRRIDARRPRQAPSEQRTTNAGVLGAKQGTSAQFVASALLSSHVVPGTEPGAAIAIHVWPWDGFGWSMAATYQHYGSSGTSPGPTVHVGLTSLEASANIELIATDRARWIMSVGPSVAVLHITVLGAPNTGPSERESAALHAGMALQAEFLSKSFIELGVMASVPVVRVDLLDDAVRSTPLWSEPSLGFVGRIGIGTALL